MDYNSQRFMTQLLTILFLFALTIPCSADWRWIGPEAGTIEQLAPDRNHPGIWYAVNNGRLYRSVDDGNQWEPTAIKGLAGWRGDGYYYFAAPPVSVQPLTSEVFVAAPDGVWVSSDLGKTFSLRAKLNFPMYR